MASLKWHQCCKYDIEMAQVLSWLTLARSTASGKQLDQSMFLNNNLDKNMVVYKCLAIDLRRHCPRTTHLLSLHKSPLVLRISFPVRRIILPYKTCLPDLHLSMPVVHRGLEHLASEDSHLPALSDHQLRQAPTNQHSSLLLAYSPLLVQTSFHTRYVRSRMSI